MKCIHDYIRMANDFEYLKDEVEIIRTTTEARVIFDTDINDASYLCVDPELSDYEILEFAHDFINALVSNING